jgi:hypothetical protein
LTDRIKVFSDVVSIDAWHDPILGKAVPSGVMVDLSFTEGRLGGTEAEFPFTFRIRLKKAVLRIFVEKPLIIDRNSVSRVSHELRVTHNIINEVKEDLRASAKVDISFSPTKLRAAIETKLKAATQSTQTDNVKAV